MVGVIEGNWEMGNWRIVSKFIKIVMIDMMIVNIGCCKIFWNMIMVFKGWGLFGVEF